MRNIKVIELLMGVAVLVGGFGSARGEPFPPVDGRTNLAAGKSVAFSPRPNYSITSKGGTDATDLTDGKTVTRVDHSMWFEPSAVGWSYPGRVSLALDLGADCAIDEIAVRLQNGSASGGGIHFPGWVEAFVSSDGEHYAKAAEFSRWNRGEFEGFGIGRERGRSYVDCLRFKDLKARGRFVGLRLYGNDLMAADELYVFGEPAGPNAAPAPRSEGGGFSVRRPQVYFHKPYLELATNMALPVPMGIVTPSDLPRGATVALNLDLPPGLELVGGNVGGRPTSAVEGRATDEDGWTRYVFDDVDAAVGADPGRGKDAVRLYLRATGWKDGQRGELRYGFEQGGWTSGSLSMPVRASAPPAAPRLKRIMASMGWWDATNMGWPDELEAFGTLGINTFNVFSYWMPRSRDDRRWAMLEKARDEGFFISNIDSPLHFMESKHKDTPEIHDQFADGSTGDRLCISYRGALYKEEVQRFAAETAAVRPDFSSVDIELWSWTGPTDARRCARCQADFEKSGLKSWRDWQKAQGERIVGDLTTAAREAVTRVGGPAFKVGGYDFRPGVTYQSVFDFDALYPKLLQQSEVSTYTSLEPADLVFIGDEVRKDRSRLPRSDVLPWNTPGDAGAFPGEAFQWSLLENYCNGARGVWFWSSRMWDSEDLLAYNRVIRAIAPVEDVIVDGDLVGAAAAVVGRGRVSGMKRNGRMVLLAADYFDETDGSITLKLDLPAESALRDLLTGQTVQDRLPAGPRTVAIPLQGRQARLLEAAPR